MIKFEDFKNRKTPLKHRLLANMLTLSVCILTFVLIGIFLLGKFDSTSKKTYDDLSFQMEVFNRQIDKQFENLAMNTSTLSNYTIDILNNYFETNNINIDDLNDSSIHLNNINRQLFDYLKNIILKTDCSGAFILLNATINTNAENAKNSKNGLYFQRGTLDETDESLLLFRGTR